MNTNLFERYANKIHNLIYENYCLGARMYNFQDYDIDEIDFTLWDFYYKDGRTCKVFSYDWSDGGKWSEPIDFKILLEDGESLENVSNNDLYMMPETLEKYGWCFDHEEYY